LTVAEIAEAQRVTAATVVKYLPDTSARERRAHDVGVLARRRYVPKAIADTLGLSDRVVRRYLAELA
jgi:predicted transcriptional regulator